MLLGLCCFFLPKNCQENNGVMMLVLPCFSLHKTHALTIQRQVQRRRLQEDALGDPEVVDPSERSDEDDERPYFFAKTE